MRKSIWTASLSFLIALSTALPADAIVPLPPCGQYIRIPKELTGDRTRELRDIDASGKGNVWVVGNIRSGDHTPWSDYSYVPRAWRWDGGAWHRIRVPRDWGEMSRVEVAGHRVVWARAPGYLLRWDGASWSRFEIPSRFFIWDIAPDGAGGLWAVGHILRRYSVSGRQVIAIGHWDGVSWTRVPTPRIRGDLYKIRVEGPDRAYATGRERVADSFPAFALEWDGIEWHRTTLEPDPWDLSENPDVPWEWDFAIVPVDQQLAWGFGAKLIDDGPEAGVLEANWLIAKWDGSAWSEVLTPSPPPASTGLRSATLVPGTRQALALGVVFLADSEGRLRVSRDAIVHVCPD